MSAPSERVDPQPGQSSPVSALNGHPIGTADATESLRASSTGDADPRRAGDAGADRGSTSQPTVGLHEPVRSAHLAQLLPATATTNRTQSTVSATRDHR